MFTLYSLLYTIVFIVLLPLFLVRSGKYISGFKQRLGFLPDLVESDKETVWIHCVSVGETNAARPLIDEIIANFPNSRIVISNTTKTGHELAKKLFSEQAELVFYFPFDWKNTVRRSLRHIKPNIVLLMETEIWFNFVREANKSGAKIALVNGRISEKSFKRYTFIKNFMAWVLHYVDLALVQHQIDARRLSDLGMRRTKIKIIGSLKFDQTIDQRENIVTEQLRERFAITDDAPLIVAASTHSPEERWLLSAFKQIYKTSDGKLPRLLIAPRHPERFEEVKKQIRETGFDWVTRSETPSARDKVAEIILMDSIGELRAVFPLAAIVFVGGSLIKHGGQNILEPAIAGKPIVTGFYTMNFEAIVKEFVERDAVIQLPKLDEKHAVEKLADVFSALLNDEKHREKLGENAATVMRVSRGATARTIEQLKEIFKPQLTGNGD
jgi:3-deoxy-D-manno-octulosonic-acid transferase